MAFFDLSNLTPLTDAERDAVQACLPRLNAQLATRFRHITRLIGSDNCRQIGGFAYMRAVKSWNPKLAPLPVYAAFWVKKYLIRALAAEVAEAAACGSLEGIPCPRPSAHDTVAVRELAAMVLSVLPRQQRVALLLRAEGLNNREVGERLGISRSLVKRWHGRTLGRVWRLVPQVRSV